MATELAVKTALVVGATGATGRLLVRQLLDRGVRVRVIVRDAQRLPDDLRDHAQLTVTEANLLDLSDAELAETVRGCQAIASCLGHNMTWKGIFGRPRRLVTDAVRRLAGAVVATDPAAPARFVLMNTAGNRNRDLEEPASTGERVVVGLLRLLVPPHADNEQAADYLRTAIGQAHAKLAWVAVRPDTLTDAAAVTAYSLHASPIRSAIFDAGSTSRINVAHFMAELITDDDTWRRWQGQMPVIYNRA